MPKIISNLKNIGDPWKKNELIALYKGIQKYNKQWEKLLNINGLQKRTKQQLKNIYNLHKHFFEERMIEVKDEATSSSKRSTRRKRSRAASVKMHTFTKEETKNIEELVEEHREMVKQSVRDPEWSLKRIAATSRHLSKGREKKIQKKEMVIAKLLPYDLTLKDNEAKGTPQKKKQTPQKLLSSRTDVPLLLRKYKATKKVVEEEEKKDDEEEEVEEVVSVWDLSGVYENEQLEQCETYATSLGHLLKQDARRFCVAEWFYPTIDAGYYLQNEFMERLQKMNLENVTELTRAEWSFIRSRMGSFKRFSKHRIEQERNKLYTYRRLVRTFYDAASKREWRKNQKAMGNEVRPRSNDDELADEEPSLKKKKPNVPIWLYPQQLAKGERVLVRLKENFVHAGVIQSVGRDQYVIRLTDTKEESKIVTVSDTDVMQLGTLRVNVTKRQFDTISSSSSPTTMTPSTNGDVMLFSPGGHLGRRRKQVSFDGEAHQEFPPASSPLRQRLTSSMPDIVNDPFIVGKATYALRRKHQLIQELQQMNVFAKANQNDLDNSFNMHYAQLVVELKSINELIKTTFSQMNLSHTYDMTNHVMPGGTTMLDTNHIPPPPPPPPVMMVPHPPPYYPSYAISAEAQSDGPPSPRLTHDMPHSVSRQHADLDGDAGEALRLLENARISLWSSLPNSHLFAHPFSPLMAPPTDVYTSVRSLMHDTCTLLLSLLRVSSRPDYSCQDVKTALAFAMDVFRSRASSSHSLLISEIEDALNRLSNLIIGHFNVPTSDEELSRITRKK